MGGTRLDSPARLCLRGEHLFAAIFSSISIAGTVVFALVCVSWLVEPSAAHVPVVASDYLPGVDVSRSLSRRAGGFKLADFAFDVI